MFRVKDLTWPQLPQSQKYSNVGRAVHIANQNFRTHAGLFVKLHVLHKSLCYNRGGEQDRLVRTTYLIVMLDFPNGNTYPCINVADAAEECDRARAAGNLYADETEVMLTRAADAFWLNYDVEENGDAHP